MRRLRQKIFMLFGIAALLLGSLCIAQGQYTRSRRVRVYTPRTYNRTRSVMNRRAAMRKVVRKRHRAARKLHRH